MFYKKRRIDPTIHDVVGYKSTKDYSRATGKTRNNMYKLLSKKRYVCFYIMQFSKAGDISYKKAYFDVDEVLNYIPAGYGVVNNDK